MDGGTSQRHLNYHCQYNTIGTYTFEKPEEIENESYKMGLLWWKVHYTWKLKPPSSHGTFTCALINSEAESSGAGLPEVLVPCPMASIILPAPPSHQCLQPCVPSLTPLGLTSVRSLTPGKSSAFPFNSQVPFDLPAKITIHSNKEMRTEKLLSLVSYLRGIISPLLPEATNKIPFP